MKRFLREASKEYYNGNPVISDDDFDAIERSTEENESVGYKDGEVNHLFRMYSLEKCYNRSDLRFTEYTIETPKLDGAAISILYINGVFDISLTRGDGVKGFNISDKVKYLVPEVINTASSTVFITGEVVAQKDVKNARNYASGALKLKNNEEFLSRLQNLTFIAYDAKGLNTNTYEETLKLLKSFGFNTVIDSNYSEFPQDGRVIRVNSNKSFESLGFTNKYPKGAIALKNRKDEEIKETILRDVIWQVGGNKVTPVAIFDEIELQDAKVSRATLHNAGFVEDLDLSIGDTILVRRAGSIIPSIIGKVTV